MNQRQLAQISDYNTGSCHQTSQAQLRLCRYTTQDKTGMGVSTNLMILHATSVGMHSARAAAIRQNVVTRFDSVLSCKGANFPPRCSSAK